MAVAGVEADVNTAFNVVVYVVKVRDLGSNIKEAENPKKSLIFLPLRATSLTPQFTSNTLGEIRKILQFGSKISGKLKAFCTFTFACG